MDFLTVMDSSQRVWASTFRAFDVRVDSTLPRFNVGAGAGGCGAVVIVLSRITACKESGPWSQIEK